MYGHKTQPTCREHDRWIAVIDATGNCSDDDRLMGQLIDTYSQQIVKASFCFSAAIWKPLNPTYVNLHININYAFWIQIGKKTGRKYSRSLTYDDLTLEVLIICECC